MKNDAKKATLYLVTKSKSYYGNVLAYCIKTSEYVYLHFGQEIWREKASRELFDYFNQTKNPDFDKVEKFKIYQRYVRDCQKY